MTEKKPQLVRQIIGPAIVLLGATPSLLAVGIVVVADALEVPLPPSLQSFGFTCAVLAPLATPLAVITAIVLTFLRGISRGWKMFCWALVAGAVASTYYIVTNFIARIGRPTL